MTHPSKAPNHVILAKNDTQKLQPAGHFAFPKNKSHGLLNSMCGLLTKRSFLAGSCFLAFSLGAVCAQEMVMNEKVAPAEAANPSGGLGGLLKLGANWSLHTQATVIEQWHGGFRSPYEGSESMSHKNDSERTFSFSLFIDRRLWTGAEVIYNPEVFQGHGLSDTFGLAGFPNGEAVKSGFPNLHYNTSRLFLRQVVGLGGEKEKIEEDVNQLSGELDVYRLTFSIGKFSAGDFFDGNTFSHDPKTQFLNWAIWESSAWDYPADVVGYTAGFVAEWNTKDTTLHYGIFMEPEVSNGVRFDKHIGKAFGQILQYDVRYKVGERKGTVRPFVYFNRAHMGNYAEAARQPYPSDITLTRAYRSKAGLGVSWDQELTSDLGAFARLSWSDGKNESWAFTEIDRSVVAGLSLRGARWSRPDDTVGLAGVVNGISSEHQRYLANGGTGLILGDGALNYSTEQILETYYDVQVFKWLHLAADYQYARHPGYNADRGPISFFAVRAHVLY